MKSSRAYLLRAIHEWIIDNGLTPYLLVNANKESTHVPIKYVDNGKIVLNISQTAVEQLVIDNDSVRFHARFDASPWEIFIPINACMAIYSKENGQGMVFSDDEKNNGPADSEHNSSNKPNKPNKPGLKLVE